MDIAALADIKAANITLMPIKIFLSLYFNQRTRETFTHRHGQNKCLQNYKKPVRLSETKIFPKHGVLAVRVRALVLALGL